MIFEANLVDVWKDQIYPCSLDIKENKIVSITRIDKQVSNYILPGFVDSHIHIESSMLTPRAFSEQAIKHGTIAVVADPHEIANVCGISGVDYMISLSEKTDVAFFYGAPSCVPATSIEASGASIGVSEIETLMKSNSIYFLAELMNYPGLINKDSSVIEKVTIAKKYLKPIDGHAPGLSDDEMHNYFSAGISTDHECTSYKEAMKKIALGVMILIRRGSAANDLLNLLPLFDKSPKNLMFCSDDLHPDALLEGHIDLSVKFAVNAGYNLFDVIRAASVNAVLHYNLPIGLLREGDSADFIVVDSLKEFNTLITFREGRCIYNEVKRKKKSVKLNIINNFNREEISVKDIVLLNDGNESPFIEVFDKSIVTKKIILPALIFSGLAYSDVSRDLLKVILINRYNTKDKPIVSMVRGFGLKEGAMATSVSHDNHNIIAVGTNDQDLFTVINLVIKKKGALAVVSKNFSDVLSLPIAGLMSNLDAITVAKKYSKLDKCIKNWGSPLSAPFMTLSFLALIVIPEIKIGLKGLFDVNSFKYLK